MSSYHRNSFFVNIFGIDLLILYLLIIIIPLGLIYVIFCASYHVFVFCFVIVVFVLFSFVISWLQVVATPIGSDFLFVPTLSLTKFNNNND